MIPNLSSKIIDLSEAYSHASTQFILPKEIVPIIKGIQDKIDPEDWTEDGKETEIHLTLMFGIVGGVKSKKLVADFIAGQKEIEVQISKLEIFKPNEKDFEVLVVRVKGAEIHSLRRKIEKAVPNEQTYPEYKPHITIGYLKRDTGVKYLDLPLKKPTFTLSRLQYCTKTGSKTDLVLGK